MLEQLPLILMTVVAIAAMALCFALVKPLVAELRAAREQLIARDLPELRDDLSRHPFKKMRRARCSVTLCTDNRLVSRTTMTDEVQKAVEAFRLDARALKDVLIYGFKRSFYAGSYADKRGWVRSVLNHLEDTLAGAGFDLRARRP